MCYTMCVHMYVCVCVQHPLRSFKTKWQRRTNRNETLGAAIKSQTHSYSHIYACMDVCMYICTIYWQTQIRKYNTHKNSNEIHRYQHSQSAGRPAILRFGQTGVNMNAVTATVSSCSAVYLQRNPSPKSTRRQT